MKKVPLNSKKNNNMNKNKRKVINKLNLKAKLVLVITLIIIVILVITAIISISTASNKVSGVSEKIKKNIEKTLNEKLKKASEISVNIVAEKSKRLLMEATILGNEEDTISLIEYGVMKKTDDLVPGAENEMVKKFSKASGILEYTRLANNLKRVMYETGDAPQSIEVVDGAGMIRGKSTGLSADYREQNNSEKIKMIFSATGGLSMTDIISVEDGLAIKAYGRVHVQSALQTQPGILIVTLPINIYFVKEMKDITGADIAVYSGKKYVAGTMYDFEGVPIALEEEESVFNEITRKNTDPNLITTQTKEKMIKFGEKKEDLKKYKFIFAPIKNFRSEVVGMIAVTVSMEDVDKAVKDVEKDKISTAMEIIFNMIIVTLVAIAFGSVCVYIYAGTITGPIDTILKTINKVSEGDLTTKVKIKRKDEIGELANGINNMVNSLRVMVYEITGMSEKIASSTAEISATSESNKMTMKEIVQTAEEIKTKSLDEKLKIRDAYDYIGQITEGIMEIAKNSERVTVKSHDSTELAIDGGKAVQDAIRSIYNIKNTVEGTAKIVDMLNEKTKVIDKVITVITGIAEQTNLLALNASIEAARAGEVGRGFAVVANAVKKLANQSGEAAEEIRKIIIGIQQETKNVSDSVEKGMVDVENGVAISQKAGEALKSIIKSVNETTEMITQITALTEEQSASSEEVKKVMGVVSMGSEETHTISSKISEEAEAQLLSVEEIVIGINSLLETAENLSTMVEVFNIGDKKNIEELKKVKKA